MVILVHSRQRINGLSKAFDFLNFGQMGCQIFFVISGYLAANSLRKNNNAPTFWKKRFASIAPGCYVMILTTQVLNAILRNWNFDLGFAENSSLISIICNVLFLQGLLPFCNNNVIGGGWYIGTTAIFYAISPALYDFVRNTKYRRWIPALMTAVTILLTASACILVPRFSNILAANTGFFYFSAVVQIPCFIMGMSFYIDKVEERMGLVEKNIAMSSLFLLASIFLFFSSMRFSNIAVVFSMGVFSVCFIKVLMQRDIRCSILEKMGKRSFYMFLTHLFFVRTLPLAYYRLCDGVVSANILYIIFLPIMFLGTYWLAGVLEMVCKPISRYMKNLQV